MAKTTTRPAFARGGASGDVFVFVNVPTEPGRWFKVHKCVVMIACPSCRARKGEPCHKPDSRHRSRNAGTCTVCRRKWPSHKATACLGRRSAFEDLGGSVPTRSRPTRCAHCKASYGIDPGTAVCPGCHAPRTSAGHYAKGAA